MLIPITRQLGIKAGLIVQDAPDPRIRRPVIRRDGVLIVPPSPESSAVHTYEITFPPCGELPEFRTHEDSDWMYVLSGRVRLRLGDQDLTLTCGCRPIRTTTRATTSARTATSARAAPTLRRPEAPPLPTDATPTDGARGGVDTARAVVWSTLLHV